MKDGEMINTVIPFQWRWETRWLTHNFTPLICRIYNKRGGLKKSFRTQLSIWIDGSPTCHPENNILKNNSRWKDQRLTAKLGTCLRVYLWLINILFFQYIHSKNFPLSLASFNLSTLRLASSWLWKKKLRPGKFPII